MHQACLSSSVDRAASSYGDGRWFEPSLRHHIPMSDNIRMKILESNSIMYISKMNNDQQYRIVVIRREQEM